MTEKDEGQSTEVEPVTGQSAEGATPSDPSSEIPERFRGKSVAEVAKAYQEDRFFDYDLNFQTCKSRIIKSGRGVEI